MKRKFAIYIVSAFLIFVAFGYGLDDLMDNLKAKLSAYYHENVDTELFLHTDKNIYTPNENIWFKAYIFSANSFKNDVLFLRLVNQDKRIVVEKRFPVYDIRSHGDLLIPDTLEEGHYKLYAFTDKMISFDPANVFVQEIEIIKNSSQILNAKVSITDSTNFIPGNTVEILCKVNENGQNADKSRGIYRLTTSKNKVITDGKFMTSPSGESLIRFKYPQLADKESLLFHAQITKGYNTVKLDAQLPNYASPVEVLLYPEGGRLVGGVKNKVMVETKDENNNTIAANIIIKQQGRQVASISTNSSGIGNFYIIPDKQDTYAMEVVKGNKKEQLPFPLKIDPEGFAMTVNVVKGLTQVSVKNQGMHTKARLVVRSYHDLLWSSAINIKGGDSIAVILPLTDSVSGLLNVTLFDADGKIWADRMIYQAHKVNYHVQVSFDKPRYHSREKVNGNVVITDLAGSPIKANVSVAVVARQTVNMATFRKINQPDLYQLNDRVTLPDLDDKNYNSILIGNKWRSGSWDDVFSYPAKGKLNIIVNAGGIFGQITSNRHRQIDIKEIYMYTMAGFTAIPVNPDGTFSISPEDLISANNDKRYIILNEGFYDKYEIKLKYYAADFDTKVGSGAILNYVKSGVDFSKSSDQLSAILFGSRILREVKIADKSSKSLSGETVGGIKVYHSTNCSDYICYNNILNCFNHPPAATPVDGGLYLSNAGYPIIYYGCNSNPTEKDNKLVLKTISKPQIFYLPDYLTSPVATPEFNSTIYWNPNMNTDQNGQITAGFFTSDITGDFKIIIQGINIETLGRIYADANFNVIK